ncbi:MAG: transposase [Paludibacteraceae bacterium]|nr:transposase [Paludibacteraceae bacterium]
MIETLNRSIKYEIYPNEEQTTQIKRTLGCARFVYNQVIEMQSGLYKANMPSMSKNDLNNYCNTFLKKEMPFLKEVDKFALTNSIWDCHRAYDNFFAKRAAYPKFKSRKEHKQSYTTNATNGNIKIIRSNRRGEKGFIQLPYLGQVKACIYRKPKFNWIIKHATIIMTASGRFFVSILFAFEKNIKQVKPKIENATGLDYSSKYVYITPENIHPYELKAYRKAQEKLEKEQRKLSHMKTGSKNYEAQRIRVAKMQEHVAFQRLDFTRKESWKITNFNDVVSVEDIDLSALSRSLNFGKAVHDNGFGMLRNHLEYKLHEKGKYFVVIDRWFPSSKRCHNCGFINSAVVLGVEEWDCPECGAHLIRDPNAAENIRDEGFRLLMERLQPDFS